MYKLLLPEERKFLEKEYRSRQKRAIFSLANILLTFTILALLPALIVSLGKKNAAVVALSAAEANGPSTESQDLLVWAQAERQKLASVVSTATSTPYEYIRRALDARPTGAKVTNLSFSRTGKALVMKGKASDRATLLQFQSDLIASGHFTKVDLPVDNLAKDKDADFQLTLTLK